MLSHEEIVKITKTALAKDGFRVTADVTLHGSFESDIVAEKDGKNI